MRVVEVKAKKIALKKAVLIVKFISPSSLKNVQIRLFCTSVEPKTKQGQAADLSIMSAIKTTKLGAKSRFDLGVCCKPCSETTVSLTIIGEMEMWRCPDYLFTVAESGGGII